MLHLALKLNLCRLSEDSSETDQHKVTGCKMQYTVPIRGMTYVKHMAVIESQSEWKTPPKMVWNDCVKILPEPDRKTGDS